MRHQRFKDLMALIRQPIFGHHVKHYTDIGHVIGLKFHPWVQKFHIKWMSCNNNQGWLPV